MMWPNDVANYRGQTIRLKELTFSRRGARMLAMEREK